MAAATASDRILESLEAGRGSIVESPRKLQPPDMTPSPQHP